MALGLCSSLTHRSCFRRRQLRLHSVLTYRESLRGCTQEAVPPSRREIRCWMSAPLCRADQNNLHFRYTLLRYSLSSSAPLLSPLFCTAPVPFFCLHYPLCRTKGAAGCDEGGDLHPLACTNACTAIKALCTLSYFVEVGNRSSGNKGTQLTVDHADLSGCRSRYLYIVSPLSTATHS